MRRSRAAGPPRRRRASYAAPRGSPVDVSPAEAVRAGHVRPECFELGVEPPWAPAQQRGEPPPDRLRAILTLTVARADTGPAQHDVLQRDRQLLADRVGQLRHDVGVRWAEPLGAAGD